MKKTGLLFGILALVTLLALLEIRIFCKTGKDSQERLSVVTSFYPMYIAAWNVIDGIDGIELTNLTYNHSGCLHDYQLSTEDMRVLENADIFIMNGGGMESFAEKILDAYPDLMIIDAGQEISFLEGQGHDHSHEIQTKARDLKGEDKEQEHDEWNAHVWMNPDHYIRQIENIKNGLMEYDSNNGMYYKKNGDNYIAQIENLKDRMDWLRSEAKGQKTAVFHAGFVYFAGYLGMDVDVEVDMDEEQGISTGIMADVIDHIREDNIPFIFAEAQYKDAIVSSIAKETGAEIYVLDPLVSGSLEKDAYIKGMNANMEQIEKALYKKGRNEVMK